MPVFTDKGSNKLNGMSKIENDLTHTSKNKTKQKLNFVMHTRC